MSFEQSLEFVGREREQYLSLERLREFSRGAVTPDLTIVNGIRDTVENWTEMLGETTSMVGTCSRYLSSIERGSRDSARTLYFLMSPVFFFVHSLYQFQRQAWRMSVTACGIFCERIDRNLLLAIDTRFQNGIYDEFNDKMFEIKNGKVKGELEKLEFQDTENLHSLLKVLYSERSTSGPHDVLPPEPVQARINLGYCLPIYQKYIAALNHIGEKLYEDSRDFTSFITQSAQLEVRLSFGLETENQPLKSIIKDRLYRLNFFHQPRALKDVSHRLSELRFTFNSALVAHRLQELSTGRDAMLTRYKRNGLYVYVERQDPKEYFKTSV